MQIYFHVIASEPVCSYTVVKMFSKTYEVQLNRILPIILGQRVPCNVKIT